MVEFQPVAAETLTVRLGERSYDITCTRQDIAGLATTLRQAARHRAVLVTDTHIQPHAERIRVAVEKLGVAASVVVLEPGEGQKCLATAALLYDRLADVRADRHTLVVAVGGGVIGDVAGFAAATYNRGMPLFMVPTTLLAMVDSSVGGKVGINHPRGKNLIGAFHQPCGVWIDLSFLDTLPDREYRSAFAEVVKYGVILDPAFFAYLETQAAALRNRATESLQHVVLHSCRLKADVVSQDERETTGLRAILNYGHTFAHAFETVAGYGTLLHGEAVSLGMVCASRLAEKLGRIPWEVTDWQRRLLAQLGLPVVVPGSWDVAELLRTMYNDKKAVAGRLRFVLPSRLGQVELVSDIPEDLVRQVLHEAAA